MTQKKAASKTVAKNPPDEPEIMAISKATSQTTTEVPFYEMEEIQDLSEIRLGERPSEKKK